MLHWLVSPSHSPLTIIWLLMYLAKDYWLWHLTSIYPIVHEKTFDVTKYLKKFLVRRAVLVKELYLIHISFWLDWGKIKNKRIFCVRLCRNPAFNDWIYQDVLIVSQGRYKKNHRVKFSVRCFEILAKNYLFPFLLKTRMYTSLRSNTTRQRYL